MNLATYIKAIGEDAAANLFGVSVYTVRSWRQFSRYPRPEKAREIVQRTGGKVSYEAIYAASRNNTTT
jgi:DNA-binding transcriptional regulator YdaS (Cro superfamily)